MTNADLTLWVEQKKEELIKGYRSPLIKYRSAEKKKSDLFFKGYKPNFYRNKEREMEMKVKKGSTVTVVDNETGKEITGRILEYTPDSIVIEKLIKFDAKKVHFKEMEK